MDFIDTFKSVTKAVADAGNHELYTQLQELALRAYDLQNEVLNLREQNRLLEEAAANDGIKVFKNDAYFFNEDGPYCSRCYDVDHKKVRMQQSDNNIGTVFYACPQCKTTVVKDTYSAPSLDNSSVPWEW